MSRHRNRLRHALTVLVLLGAQPLFASTPVIDQTALATPVTLAAGSTTVAMVTTATVASGGFIVCGVANDPTGTVSSVASSPALTWSAGAEIKQAANATSGDNVAIVWAQAPSGYAIGGVITVTFSGSVVARQLACLSFTLIATSSPIDGTPVSATQATAGWSSGNYVTSDAAAIVAASEVDTATTNTTTSPSIEVADFQEAVAGNTLAVEYRIDATSGTRTVAGTWASGSDGVVVATAFKGAAAGGAAVVRGPLLGVGP